MERDSHSCCFFLEPPFHRRQDRFLRQDRARRVQPLLEQPSDLALQVIKVSKLQARINNGEHLPGSGLFVDEHPLTFAKKLRLYFQQPLPFEHHR